MRWDTLIPLGCFDGVRHLLVWASSREHTCSWRQSFDTWELLRWIGEKWNMSFGCFWAAPPRCIPVTDQLILHPIFLPANSNLEMSERCRMMYCWQRTSATTLSTLPGPYCPVALGLTKGPCVKELELDQHESTRISGFVDVHKEQLYTTATCIFYAFLSSG